MKQLRGKAKIEYVGEFAGAASAAPASRTRGRNQPCRQRGAA